MRERRSFSHKSVFTGLFVSLVLALLVAAYIFFRYVRYEPSAHQHIPEKMQRVTRMNVEQAVVYEPFRRHVLPLFELHRTTPEPRLQRFKRMTTIELGVDLREIVFAQGGADSWLMALGGHFRRDGVIEGVARMLQEEGLSGDLREDPRRLVHSSGAAFSVSEDGVLLLASNESLLKRALPANSSSLPFRAGAALEVLVRSFPAHCCSGLHRARLRVFPGDHFSAHLRLETVTASSPRALRQLLSSPVRDFLYWGEPKWEAPSADTQALEATARLEPAEFEAMVKRLAKAMRATLAR